MFRFGTIKDIFKVNKTKYLKKLLVFIYLVSKSNLKYKTHRSLVLLKRVQIILVIGVKFEARDYNKWCKR